MSATEYLIDASTRHQIMLQRLSVGAFNKLKPILEQLQKDVKARLRDDPTNFQCRSVRVGVVDPRYAVPETNKDLLQSLRDMVETAKQLIHNGYFYIDIIEEQIRHGYNVKANQARVAQYKREITMLENWINANLQIDDASIF